MTLPPNRGSLPSMVEPDAGPSGSYASTVTGNLHVVRWLRTPSIIDLDAVTREIEIAAVRNGTSMVSVSIISPEVDPPAGDVRKRMADGLQRLLKPCDSVHCVIEGSGFKHVLLLSVVTSLVLVAGHRKQMFVHGSFHDFLRAWRPRLETPAGAIAQLLREQGFIAD